MTSYDHECSIFIAERVEFAFAHPLAAASFLAEKIKIFVQVNLAQLFTFFCGKSGIQTHGTVEPYAGFRVRSIRSLWHLSL